MLGGVLKLRAAPRDDDGESFVAARPRNGEINGGKVAGATDSESRREQSGPGLLFDRQRKGFRRGAECSCAGLIRERRDAAQAATADWNKDLRLRRDSRSNFKDPDAREGCVVDVCNDSTHYELGRLDAPIVPALLSEGRAGKVCSVAGEPRPAAGRGVQRAVARAEFNAGCHLRFGARSHAAAGDASSADFQCIGS